MKGIGIDSIKKYVEWCREHNFKSCYYTSLQLYNRYLILNK